MNKALKPSGVDWIGNIPVNWDILRLKDIFCIQGGSTPNAIEIGDENPIDWITPTDFSDTESNLFKSNRKITYEGHRQIGKILSKKGELILSCRAPAGKVAYVCNEKGFAFNQGCKSLKNRKVAINKFFFYGLISARSEVDVLSRGTTFQEISTSNLEKVRLPFPPVPEQIQIANYLDKVTALLDKKKALLERKKALLQEHKKSLIHEAVTKGLDPSVQMKDSGVDWIGEVPLEWSVRRLADVLHVSNGYPFATEEFKEAGVPIIKMKNINGDGPFAFFSGFALQNAKQYEVVTGDILYGLSGSIGVALWNDGKAYLNQRLARGRAKRGQSQSYFFYCSQIAMEAVSTELASTTIKNVSSKQLESIAFPSPNLAEQIFIAEYLDKVTRLIDSQVSLIDKKLESLSQLRTSVIHEAVTKGVPSYAQPQKEAA